MERIISEIEKLIGQANNDKALGLIIRTETEEKLNHYLKKEVKILFNHHYSPLISHKGVSI